MTESRVRSGFTLFELLIGLAILGVLMTAFMSFFGNTLQVTRNIDVRNTLLQDAQTAQQLVASRAQEAWYVFPPGTALGLPIVGGVDAWEVTRPIGGTTWSVGTNPIFAFIVPPLNSRVPCEATTGVAGSPPVGTTAATAGWLGCYRFLAYYPVTRSSYVTNTAASLVNRLPADNGNPNAWVLMQYSAYFRQNAWFDNVATDGALTALVTAANTGTNTTDLVADYVQNGTALVTLPTPNATTPPVGTVNVTVGTATFPKIEAVTLDFTLARAYSGRTFTVGLDRTNLDTNVAARNVRVVP